MSSEALDVEPDEVSGAGRRAGLVGGAARGPGRPQRQRLRAAGERRDLRRDDHTRASGTVTVDITDDPLQPRVTPVKAVHFTELRTRIDALPGAACLTRFSWTDPILRAGVTRVRLLHLLELRSALAAAYSAAGRSTPSWTDTAAVEGMTPIRAVHLMKLRAAVVDLK